MFDINSFSLVVDIAITSCYVLKFYLSLATVARHLNNVVPYISCSANVIVISSCYSLLDSEIEINYSYQL